MHDPMMPQDKSFLPSKEDRDLISRIIEYVRSNPNVFHVAGKYLDKHYSSEAIWALDVEDAQRTIRAEAHEQWGRQQAMVDRQRIRRSLAAAPNNPHPLAGALSGEAEEGYVSPPQPSATPANTTPNQRDDTASPPLPLNKRFLRALRGQLEESPDLYVLKKGERLHLAKRQVMLGWLYFDPARAEVGRLTDFQDLITQVVEDPLVEGLIVADAGHESKRLLVRRDGYQPNTARKWLERLGFAMHYVEIPHNTVGQGGMTWQEAMDRAENHVKAHDGAFTSVKRLAEIVGCSRPTLDKAIRQSAYLKARKAEKLKVARIQPLTKRSLDEASEYASRKDDSELPDQDVDLETLINEQMKDEARNNRQAKTAQRRSI